MKEIDFDQIVKDWRERKADPFGSLVKDVLEAYKNSVLLSIKRFPVETQLIILQKAIDELVLNKKYK